MSVRQLPKGSQSPEMQTLPSVSSLLITENFHNLEAEEVLIFQMWLEHKNEKYR